MVFAKVSFSQNQRKSADSLVAILNTLQEDTSRVNILNEVAKIFAERDDYKTAFNYVNEALTLSQKINFKKGISTTYYVLGSIYGRQGDDETALKNYFLARKICKEINFIQGLVNTNNNIGGIYSFQKNYTLALSYYNENLRIGNENHNKKVIANTYLVIGGVYTNQENYPGAMKNDLEALKVYEEINDKRGIADAYNSVAVACAGQGNYSEALKNYEISLKAAQEANYDDAVGRAHNNIAVMYSEEGDYNNAVKHQLSALRIHQQIENTRSVIISYSNLAEYYMALKKNTQAKNYIDKSLLLATKVGDKKNMASAYIVYGQLNMRMNKLPEAKNYLNKALQLSKEAGFNYIVRNCYDNLSRLDSMMGDFKGAYQYLRLYGKKKDSIFNVESNKLVSQLNIQYETEKKDNDIQLLNKDNEIKTIKIGRQNAIIRYLIAGFLLLIFFALIYYRLYNQKRKTKFRHQLLETEMKALRSQMNPHFTFNVLNSIQYFVSERDMESAEIYLEKFSTLIRMILDQSRMAYISFEQEVVMLRLYLELEEMRFEKKFEYSLNIDSDINPDKILIPGMLIQPVVENAIKHGIEHKEGNALINISFSLRDTVLLCTVTDNGVGRATAEKLGESKPHKSVATSIIRERIDALSLIYNLRLSYKTEDLLNDEGKPEGTRVSIEIPIGIKNEEFTAELMN